jgi:hypothetical protein
MAEEVLAAIWRRRVGWSRAATRLKRKVTYARTAALLLSVLGAVLGALAATLLSDVPHWRMTSAGLSAALLATATFITAQFLTFDAVRAWIRARSVSEQIKAEVFTFRAGASPYGIPGDVRVLQRKVFEIEEQVRDLERHVAGVSVKASTPPPPLTPARYVEERIEQQIHGYYRPKARLYSRVLATLRGFEVALGLTAAVLAGLAAYFGGAASGSGAPGEAPAAANAGVAAWIAVATTLGAALAAHIAAGRYEFLLMSFHATARRLEDLVNEWRAIGAPTDPQEWSALVAAAEEAISIENESWLAKWTEQDRGL